MLEGPSHENLSEMISIALPVIAKLLNYDNDILVREAASIALEATAEFTPNFYFQESLFMEIVPLLTKGIDSPPSVSLHVAKLWHFIGEEVVKRNAGKDLILCDN